MITLGIETSCDETALALVETETNTGASTGTKSNTKYRILAEVVHSQIALHEKFGGVFPMMAKREHAKTLVPLLGVLFRQYSEQHLSTHNSSKSSDTGNTGNAGAKTEQKFAEIKEIFGEKELELFKNIKKDVESGAIPLHGEIVDKIDQIAVTHGPGLEPTLWVGLNFAKALSILLDKPLVPVNHMEGHLLGSLLKHKTVKNASGEWHELLDVDFPAIALLVSGGHTELIHVEEIGKYKKIGQTVDDASGEAFDKIARMLNIPYPGGYLLSKLASEAREKGIAEIPFPRPMMHSGDYNFSFSGLKTAVLYTIQSLKKTSSESGDGGNGGDGGDGDTAQLSDDTRMQIALGVENAIVDSLVKKTARAVEEHGVASLILGGGVSANTYLQSELLKALEKIDLNIKIYTPAEGISGDNAVMIALVGAISKNEQVSSTDLEKMREIKANGTLSL